MSAQSLEDRISKALSIVRAATERERSLSPSLPPAPPQRSKVSCRPLRRADNAMMARPSS
jgi:hypothetical protein